MRAWVTCPRHVHEDRRGIRLLAVLAGVVLLVVATACATTGAGDPPGGPDRPEVMTTLRVGVLPIVDTAAVHRARAAGYYAAEGLDVELVTVQGGALAIPQLVTGELDLTWSSWTSVILAHHQHVADLRVLPGAGYSAAANTFVVMTTPATGIRTPTDLTGRRIAINTFASITELAASSALQANGIDPDRVTFVEIPFPDMIAALETGQVDAITVVEPQLTQAATRLGAQVVLDVAAGPTADLPEAGLVTTDGFAAANPAALAAFERAIARAQADLADRSLVEQTLPTYTRIDATTAPLLHLGTWTPVLDTTQLQRVADLMHQFALLPEPFDVTPLLRPTP